MTNGGNSRPSNSDHADKSQDILFVSPADVADCFFLLLLLFAHLSYALFMYDFILEITGEKLLMAEYT